MLAVNGQPQPLAVGCAPVHSARRGRAVHRLAMAMIAAALAGPAESPAQTEWPPARQAVRAFGDAHWPPGQQYLGSQICQGCHADAWDGFPGNPHFRSIARGGQAPARTGCEGCHGPAGLHVIDPDNAKILAFGSLLPGQAQEVCLRCHTGDIGKIHIRRSVHLTGDIGCTSCHSIHESGGSGPLLVTEERELCYGCHREIETQFNMPFKHRVNEGAMECTDCHNPHGAPVSTWRTAHAPRMVSQALGNDIPCTDCHADKRGPFVHEHPPVRVEGCPACHSPHGSVNPRLLARPAVFALCLECHNDIAGFGLDGNGITSPSSWFHNLADPAFRDCVVCHSRIHGSNADPKFRR